MSSRGAHGDQWFELVGAEYHNRYDKKFYNAFNWLHWLGYGEEDQLKAKGKCGVLSNKKRNWGAYRLAYYLGRKHPELLLVWQTQCKLGAE